MSFFNPTPSVSVLEARDHAVREGVVFVDVREPYEYATGHAEGASNCPLSTFDSCVRKLKSAAEVYVICQTGGRSARAVALLRTHGIPAVNVAGGTSEWRRRGLPIT
jgi:rhodanese-related sulfurtransferase